VNSIVSGRTTLPEQLAATRVGGADRVEVGEHRAGVGAVVQQRGDHHRPAGACRHLFQQRHGHLPALGDHVDAAAAVRHRLDQRQMLGVAGQARRHRHAALAVVRRAGGTGETHRAGVHGLADHRRHALDLVRVASRCAASSPITQVRTDEWPT
jgi:hypothetical protein